jgi:hypothetical protein
MGDGKREGGKNQQTTSQRGKGGRGILNRKRKVYKTKVKR